MIEKSTTRYLIVAEIKTKGFLLRYYNNLEDAKAFMKHIFNLSLEFRYSEMSKVENKLDYFASYEAKGNYTFVGKSIFSDSNGAYTVSVVKIDVDNFCLKTFIRERENHSLVFDFESYGDKLDKLLKLFPNLDLIAN